MACRLSLKSEALTRKSWDSYLSCKQETRLKTALCWPPTLLKIKRIGWSWNAMPFNLNPFQNENVQCVFDHVFRTFTSAMKVEVADSKSKQKAFQIFLHKLCMATLNTGPLSVGGYSQASQAHKALSSTFYCGGEFIWRLIQDYRPFVARSSPQKVDIKIIKTCPNPRTHRAPPFPTEIAQNTPAIQSNN